ncbi:MAG: phage holin family protein [Sediminibacterium sp.]|nr:phage holin family protein [Sediminibacterium sp.]
MTNTILKFLARAVATAVGVWITDWLMDGIRVNSTSTALAVGVVLGLLNQFVKPLLILLTIPITVFTFGIFLLFLIARMLFLAADLIPGFEVSGWWSAIIGSILISIFAGIVQGLLGKPGSEKQQ